MNIGKMILEKDRKLLNQCNSLGGFPPLPIIPLRDSYFMVLLLGAIRVFQMVAERESRGAHRQREHHDLSNRRLPRSGALARGAGPPHSEIVCAAVFLSRRFPKLLDIQDVDGQTALHVAASVGNVECVKVLLDAGADSTLRDAEGLTPLQVGFPRGAEAQQAEKACFPACEEILETKWRELEERAREEMEELLRMEGFDPKEWRCGSGLTRRLEPKKAKKAKRKGRRAGREPATNTVHREFQCDRCLDGREIEGVRYACRVGGDRRA